MSEAPKEFGVVLAALMTKVDEATARSAGHEMLVLMVAAGHVAQRALLAEGLVTMDVNSGN